MIEIIIEHVEMPPVSERRYQKQFKNNKWSVIDTQNDNALRYEGEYRNVMIAWHNLNKKHYRDINTQS